MTPTEIANFLCNMPKELREWFIAQPNSHTVLLHIMKVYGDNKRRLARIRELRDVGDIEFYTKVVSIPNDVFMSFIRDFAKTI